MIIKMLPVDSSPNEKRNRNQRVLEWVQKSAGVVHGSVKKSQTKRMTTTKRKLADEENHNKSPTKKCRSNISSRPLSPKKFYLPNGDNSPSKAIPLPCTPESKASHVSSSICVSPGKLDGIYIRKGWSASTPHIESESESPASTPVKRKTYKISNGLDSPVTDDSFKTPESKNPKRFSKLGHRLNGKTPLQQIKESIKKDTQRIRISYGESRIFGRKESKASPDVKEDAASSATPKSESSIFTTTSSPATEVETANNMDRSHDTLTNDSERLVQKKLLPLFQRTRRATRADKDQMLIDAGQKDLDQGKHCSTCMMMFNKGDPDDEGVHKKFHSRLIQALKFPGWKKENVASCGPDHRVVYIDRTDPPHCHRKVESLKLILDQELGFVQEDDIFASNRRVYLYVGDDKQIKGVCIAEPISRANELLGDRASIKSVDASIGVNRIWVYAKYRRQGVATALLDAIRSTLRVGLYVDKREIAFSDPTNHGKMFAAKYTGTKSFLVYQP